MTIEQAWAELFPTEPFIDWRGGTPEERSLNWRDLTPESKDRWRAAQWRITESRAAMTGKTPFERWYYGLSTAEILGMQEPDVFAAGFKAGYTAASSKSEVAPDWHPTCLFRIPTHSCALPIGHKTPHQMVRSPLLTFR